MFYYCTELELGCILSVCEVTSHVNEDVIAQNMIFGNNSDTNSLKILLQACTANVLLM